MSTGQIITALEKLIKLHKGLNELASRKTDIIKLSDMDALTALLNEEQKYVKAIEMIDREREVAVEEFLESKVQSAELLTITRVIELSTDTEADGLNRLKGELLEEVMQLKEQNYLNQQLVYQSLQFINITLNILQPQNQQYNYEKPAPARKMQEDSNSMFDSKA